MRNALKCTLLAVALTLLGAIAQIAGPAGAVAQSISQADSARYVRGFMPVAVAVVERLRFPDTDAVVQRLPGSQPPFDMILMRQGAASADLLGSAFAVLGVAHEQEGTCPQRREVFRVAESSARPVWWEASFQARAEQVMDVLGEAKPKPLRDVGRVKWTQLWIPRLLSTGERFSPSEMWKGVCSQGGLSAGDVP